MNGYIDDPRLLADLKAYFMSKGYRINGEPTYADVTGYVDDLGGVCSTCGPWPEGRVAVNLWYASDEAPRNWVEIDNFNLADFMQFVYSRIEVAA